MNQVKSVIKSSPVKFGGDKSSVESWEKCTDLLLILARNVVVVLQLGGGPCDALRDCKFDGPTGTQKVVNAQRAFLDCKSHWVVIVECSSSVSELVSYSIDHILNQSFWGFDHRLLSFVIEVSVDFDFSGFFVVFYCHLAGYGLGNFSFGTTYLDGSAFNIHVNFWVKILA